MQPLFRYLLICYRNCSTNSITHARESATPPRLSALHKRPPSLCVDLNPKLSGRCSNALPRSVALGVSDAFDLVESRNRVAHVSRIVDRLLALLCECEAIGRHPASLTGAQRSALPSGCHLMASFGVDDLTETEGQPNAGHGPRHPEEGYVGVGAGDETGDVVAPPPPGAGDVTVVVVDGAPDCDRVPNQFHCVQPKKSRMSTSSASIAAAIPGPAP